MVILIGTLSACVIPLLSSTDESRAKGTGQVQLRYRKVCEIWTAEVGVVVEKEVKMMAGAVEEFCICGGVEKKDP